MQPRELADRIGNVHVVDVRLPHEWEAGRVDGAVHIPLQELADRLNELDRSTPVVTVCRSGSRSADAAARLRQDGFDAENLDGGLLAWAQAGLPLTTPDGEPGSVADPEDADAGGDGPGADPGFQAALVELALEIQEHFGEHDPSEEEVRGYLRDRMIREGHTPEEADAVLARITSDGPSAAGA